MILFTIKSKGVEGIETKDKVIRMKE